YTEESNSYAGFAPFSAPSSLQLIAYKFTPRGAISGGSRQPDAQTSKKDKKTPFFLKKYETFY
ncbi:MAG: hypothetical protein AAB968_04220, partial [Patescibacteria group bacterium]